MISKTTLIGHVGSEPDIKKLDSGVAVGRFSLATSESYKDAAGELQTNTEWHNITVYRQQAELAERLIKTGALIYVEGKITYRKFTDKNGIERTSTDIVCNTFRLLGKKEGSVSNDSYPTDEPKAVAKQETKSSGDIFETQKAPEMYQVVHGEQKGKIVTVLNQDEKGVSFLLDRKELFMSHAKFSEFHLKMISYTPEDLNVSSATLNSDMADDDDLPF